MARRRTQAAVVHSVYPTHKLVIWHPETKARTIVGSGWMKENGRLGFKINPGIQINWLDVAPFGDLQLVVWPVEEEDDNNGAPF